jgi:cytosine/adenosine deaminase-related metal-dependent hydrolase
VIRRLNQEAGKSVSYCGMDEVEALKLVTLNPAVQLRIDDRVGSLEAGKDADFVVWSGHPLSVYSRVERTWIDGAEYFTLERDASLREEVEEERARLVQRALAAREGKAARTERAKRPATWRCEDVEDVWHGTALR